MGIVFVDITMSLDGFVTAPNDDVGQGLGDGGEYLHDWVMGGPWTYASGPTSQPTKVDRELLEEANVRAGAAVMGRRVYDVSEGWGDDPPFSVACFVLTHRPHARLVKGAASFTFVTDGIHSALAHAKAAAGDKDVLVMGGANAIQQYLAAGLVDELQIHVAPVLLGQGKRLFDHLGAARIELEPTGVIASPFASHLRFRVVK